MKKGLFILIGLALLLMSETVAQAQDSGDCTSRQLRTATNLLSDAQDALDAGDVTTALDSIQQANDLLAECGPEGSGDTTSRLGTTGGSKGGTSDSTDNPGFEVADVDTKDFESKDESYTFTYPDSWFFAVDLGTRSVVTNTADASVEILNDNPEPSRGNMWVFVAPFDFGTVRDLSSYITDVVGQVRPDDELTDPIEFEIQGPGGRRDTRRIAYVDIVDGDQRVIMVEMGDGWWGVLFVNAIERELDDFMSEVLVIASSMVHD